MGINESLCGTIFILKSRSQSSTIAYEHFCNLAQKRQYYQFPTHQVTPEMKVGYVTRLLSQQGAPRTAVLSCIAMNRIGHQTTLIFTREANGLKTYADLLRYVNYTIVKDSSFKSSFTWLFGLISSTYMQDRKGILRLDLELLRELYKFIDVDNYDYFICQNRWAGISGYYIWKKYGIPYSVIIQESLQDYRNKSHLDYPQCNSSLGHIFSTTLFRLVGHFANALEEKVLNNALTVFATSRRIYESIIKKYPTLQNKVSLNHRGLDYLTPIDMVPYSSRENSIVIDSQWDKGRHPEIYIGLAKLCRSYDFLIYGGWRDSELKKEVLRSIEVSKLKNVKLIERYTQDELLDAFKRAKFACRFTFKEDGIPSFLTLAVSCGTPLIINRDSAGAEILVEGGGVIINDFSEFASSIELMDNENMYMIKQRELQKIREHYSWTAHVKLLLDAAKRNKE